VILKASLVQFVRCGEQQLKIMFHGFQQKERLTESNVSNFRWDAGRTENHRHIGGARYDYGLIKLVVNQPGMLHISDLASMHYLPGS
jgi:hypothetical protein